MIQKHKHDWEELRHSKEDKKPYAIKCKICKKVSYPNKMPNILRRRNGRIRYATKGAFGKQ